MCQELLKGLPWLVLIGVNLHLGLKQEKFPVPLMLLLSAEEWDSPQLYIYQNLFSKIIVFESQWYFAIKFQYQYW